MQRCTAFDGVEQRNSWAARSQERNFLAAPKQPNSSQHLSSHKLRLAGPLEEILYYYRSLALYKCTRSVFDFNFLAPFLACECEPRFPSVYCGVIVVAPSKSDLFQAGGTRPFQYLSSLASSACCGHEKWKTSQANSWRAEEHIFISASMNQVPHEIILHVIWFLEYRTARNAEWSQKYGGNEHHRSGQQRLTFYKLQCFRFLFRLLQENDFQRLQFVRKRSTTLHAAFLYWKIKPHFL